MNEPVALLERLDAIGTSLASHATAIALLGVGSVGASTDRLDEFSDLDFFAIVEADAKLAFIADLGWLSDVQPISFAFQNTPDGHKVLFDDGIFCEFAVFTPAELERADFRRARTVWAREGIELSSSGAAPARTLPTVEVLANEALSNLYVGLLRERRGEHLAAFRMIQTNALDRILELHDVLGAERDVERDPYGSERRFEARHPDVSDLVRGFALGIERNDTAAAALLDHLETTVGVDAAMRRQIERLLEYP